MFRTIPAQELRDKIAMTTAIELMREAFSFLSSGDATVPPRTVIEAADHSGRALFMPSYSRRYGLFGLKMVSVFDHNAARHLPVIQGNMLVMDARVGSSLAMIDAASLTALRTGAASGLATQLLAREDARLLAVFGTGTQARTQVEAVCCVRNIQKVAVFGTSADKEQAFCRDLSGTVTARLQPGDRADLGAADVICTATASPTPLFDPHEIKPGVHINGIGSYKPNMQELPAATIKQSLLVVDQREAALAEAGDVIIPIQEGIIGDDHIYAELGEIITGKKKGRTGDKQVTVFKSVGNAVQDLALANYLVKNG